MGVTAGLGPKLRHVAIWFRYSPDTTALIKTIPGAKFVPKDKGGPYWALPLDLESCRALRAVFGRELRIEPELRAWAREALNQETRLTHLALADDAELTVLPLVLPDLYNFYRPYQRAGARFIATADHPLIADEPGLGKTVEVIGGIFEAHGMDIGTVCVAAPMTSLESVWEYELLRWQPYEVIIATGSHAAREQALDRSWGLAGDGIPHWLLINSEMMRYQRIYLSTEDKEKYKNVKWDKKSQCFYVEVPAYPTLFDTRWTYVILDEVHRGSVNNPHTLGGIGAHHFPAVNRIAISGTPVRGKPINLWGILNWLNPKPFSSKWRFAEQWLVIEEDHWGKKIGGIRKEREEDLWRFLTPYLLRRTTADVLPELPPVQWIPRLCDMEKKQLEQYEKFAADAEIRIDEEHLSATSVLAEYARLKFFATSECSAERDSEGRLLISPTDRSCKLPVFQEILEELGIWGHETGAQLVFFSQFSQVVDMVTAWLRGHKVIAEKITGGVNVKRRNALIKSFQSGDRIQVLGLTTTAGGVAITLDRADTAVFFDETWVPDEQEQAVDRLRRASRIHHVNAYLLRSRNTIEQYIQEVNADKKAINDSILDLRRAGLRSTHPSGPPKGGH